MTKKSQNNEYPEFGADFRYHNAGEAKREATKLMQMRLERMKNLSPRDIMIAKLLQLKFQMEAFLEEPIYDQDITFTSFVKRYIDILYTSRNQFAKDVKITPVNLSQILNLHREPNEDFMLKLIIHSEKVFKHVGSFSQKIWYNVYHHEKMCKLLLKKDNWHQRLENDVRFRASL